MGQKKTATYEGTSHQDETRTIVRATRTMALVSRHQLSASVLFQIFRCSWDGKEWILSQNLASEVNIYYI